MSLELLIGSKFENPEVETPEVELETENGAESPMEMTPPNPANPQESAPVMPQAVLLDTVVLDTVVLDLPQPQIQQRLFNLTLQFDQIQTQLDSLLDEVQTSGNQVSLLTQHLTDIRALDAIHERLAELTTIVADQQAQMASVTQLLHQSPRQDQIATLLQRLNQTAQQDQVETLTHALEQVARQDQVATLVDALEQVARQDQVADLMQRMVSQEQIDRLLQLVADRDQLASLEESLKKLTRTQFKTNTLGENKEQQIETALTTLREIGNRRQQIEQNQLNRTAQQLHEARNNSRAELAAELLPALDSLELALDNGESLLTRQQQRMTTVVNQQVDYIVALSQPPAPTQLALKPGFWQRMFQNQDEPQEILAAPAPDPLPAATLHETFHEASDTMSAWLKGLELVRDRFQGLLASEGIQEIDALHQPFDPRLHVAVDTQVRSDLPANSVARVVRKGYRQNNRVLRYAEVVVAR